MLGLSDTEIAQNTFQQGVLLKRMLGLAKNAILFAIFNPY
jgi:hypothetical protein